MSRVADIAPWIKLLESGLALVEELIGNGKQEIKKARRTVARVLTTMGGGSRNNEKACRIQGASADELESQR